MNIKRLYNRFLFFYWYKRFLPGYLNQRDVFTLEEYLERNKGGCKECSILTYNGPGWVMFCYKHSPTIYLEKDSLYFNEAIREGHVIMNNKKFKRT